jgi:hypothetical protein
MAKTTYKTDSYPYRVYTALLTQNGGDSLNETDNIPLTIGVTYMIKQNSILRGDFTNVGAPNNNDGTYFVATGTTPNVWGQDSVFYNTGAPVVTVLENTIGNIWFTYADIGSYIVNSDGLFTLNKSIGICMPNQYVESPSDLYNYQIINSGVDNFTLVSFYNYEISNTIFGIYAENAIEIKVYN